MEKTAVQRLAAVLRTMVLIVFVLNLLCLLFVPGMAVICLDRGGRRWYGPCRREGFFLLELSVWADSAVCWNMRLWVC